MSVVWTAAAPAECIEYRSEGETLLFDRRSRQTHLLTESAHTVLVALRSKPMSAQELALSLEPGETANSCGAVQQIVERILGDLDAVGLVEPSA